MTKVEMNRRIKSFQHPRSVSVLAGEDVTVQVFLSTDSDTYTSMHLNMTGEQAAELGATLIEAALSCNRDKAIAAMQAVRLRLFAEEVEEAQ